MRRPPLVAAGILVVTLMLPAVAPGYGLVGRLVVRAVE